MFSPKGGSTFINFLIVLVEITSKDIKERYKCILRPMRCEGRAGRA